MTVEANHMIMDQTWVVNTRDYKQKFRKGILLADYIPCFAHSLNLVGHSAVENVSAASKFFELVENVYCFFTASTHRWELLVNVLGGLAIVKRLSDTRWAAHSDASKALNCGYEKIKMVLEQFTENLDETAKARQEARGILSKLNTLENCILLVFWSVVMERFHQTSIKLQSTNMDLNEAVKLSLNNYVSS